MHLARFMFATHIVGCEEIVMYWILWMQVMKYDVRIKECGYHTIEQKLRVGGRPKCASEETRKTESRLSLKKVGEAMGIHLLGLFS